MSVERDFNEPFVARLAASEKQSQRVYRPAISVHKWFARRPGALFRALALAELASTGSRDGYLTGHQLDGVCLDPFMGGGTPLMEAARLGLGVVGYDTNPMARWIVERELEDVDPDELRAAGERVARDVEREVGRLYLTRCTGCGGEAEVRHFIWLRHHRCVCGEEHPLLADTMLVSTRQRRHPREVHLCPHCLGLGEFEPRSRPDRCEACSGRYDEGLYRPGSVHVCACGEPFRVPPRGTVETPCERLVAIDYHCGGCSTSGTTHRFKPPGRGDRQRLRRAERLCAQRRSRFWPDELIPSGKETERLLRWGYLRWRDLFSPRQLYGLEALADRIAGEPPGPVKRALQTAFSDFLRSQNTLCRYDRQLLKPADVFAVHGFPVPRVACEAALLGRRGHGSGGFRHALDKYERAKRWCRDPYETERVAGQSRRVRTPPETLAPLLVKAQSGVSAGGALLRRGSLSDMPLQPGSVSMVLTDPPYFANVQYAELMDFCYVWLRRLAPETPYFDVDGAKTAYDAVGSDASSSPVRLGEFTERLAAVFTAAADALKDGGAFVFTYHHNELEAYVPVVVACLDAGLVPTSLWACPSELRVSTHIQGGRRAATVDAVLCLRKPPISDQLRCDFEVPRTVRARVKALLAAGHRATAADRTTLRYATQALHAVVRLSDDWEHDAPVEERLAAAYGALPSLSPRQETILSSIG